MPANRTGNSKRFSTAGDPLVHLINLLVLVLIVEKDSPSGYPFLLSIKFASFIPRQAWDAIFSMFGVSHNLISAIFAA